MPCRYSPCSRRWSASAGRWSTFFGSLSIAVLYAAVRRGIAGKATPNTRYLLACGALAAMMGAPLVAWGLLRSSDAKTGPVDHIRSTPTTASSTGVDSIPIVTLPAAVRDTVSGVRQACSCPGWSSFGSSGRLFRFTSAVSCSISVRRPVLQV